MPEGLENTGRDPQRANTAEQRDTRSHWPRFRSLVTEHGVENSPQPRSPVGDGGVDGWSSMSRRSQIVEQIHRLATTRQGVTLCHRASTSGADCFLVHDSPARGSLERRFVFRFHEARHPL